MGKMHVMQSMQSPIQILTRLNVEPHGAANNVIYQAELPHNS